MKRIRTKLSNIVLSAIPAVVLSTTAAAVDKLVDTVLLAHDPSAEGIFRWSEGSIIPLDSEKHLMMLVVAIGSGGHDHSSGDIVRLDSHDGGITWTPPDQVSVFQKNIGKANVMSPSLLRLDQNEILFFFVVKNTALTDSGTWMRRSTDNGKTWSEPVSLPYQGYGGLSSDRAFLSPTGRIILPSWVSMDSLKSTHAYCHYSDDRGQTWKSTDLITVPKGATGRRTDPAAEEPAIVALNDGRLMMFIRVYLKSIYVSYSEDDGATWSKPISSGIPSPGAMPTLRRMPDGNLLLIWNWAPPEKIDGPWPRNRLSSVISKDDGSTWTSLRHLDDGGDDFPGKTTMANVAFHEGNAIVTYSKSQTRKNAYDWRLQVIPILWFHQGDTAIVYGKDHAKTIKDETEDKNITFPGAEWTRGDPTEFGISAKALEGVDELMRKAEANGVLIRDGRMIVKWNYSELGDTMINVKSITKCITGILYGLALGDVMIPGPDTRVKDLWPDFEGPYAGPDFETGPYAGDITFDHLASATAGLKTIAPYWQHFTSRGGGIDFRPPGPPSDYNNDHAMYLAGALTYLYKQDLLEVLRERVLKKIGGDARWMTNGERSPSETGVHGTFRSVASDAVAVPPDRVALGDGKSARWVSGFSRSSWTAEDLARVGWLFLNDGQWNGEQIIPLEYTKECRQKIPGRSYLAWRTVEAPNGAEWWFMSGAGGQFCVLIPEHGIVMAKINEWPNKENGAHRSRPQVGLREFVPLLCGMVKQDIPIDQD